MIGKKILHYKILEKLGEGGMGVVYKAEDTKLERTVALKFLSLTSIGDEEKKRFKREAKAAASLNHPNIATIHAIDEADDQTFIAGIVGELWLIFLKLEQKRKKGNWRDSVTEGMVP